jgi:hypothetical protein
MRPVLLAIILILGFSVTTRAQDGFEIGGWIGSAWYFGDLNNNNSYQMPGWSFGVLGRYDFDDRVALRLGGSMARVRADDAVLGNEYERIRNLHFRSPIWEGHLALEFNFLPYVHGSKDNNFTPHIFGGFVVFGYNPQAKLDDRWLKLSELGTEGQEVGNEYYPVGMGWLLGGGFKFDIDHRWSVNVEYGARFTNTDYLDDVSGQYPDPDVLLSRRGIDAVRLADPSTSDPKLGELGRQRGNSRDNDRYHFFSIGIMRYFSDLKCPAISRGY